MTMGHERMYYVLSSRDWICGTIKGNRLDGLVFIGPYDKIEPAIMVAVARLDILSIMLNGGPIMPGYSDGKPPACSHVRESAGK